MRKPNVIYDMETNDFDDYLTLCILAGSKEVNLVGVTINPGTPKQVGLIRATLDHFENGKDILVGASNKKNRGNEPEISEVHYHLGFTFEEGTPDMSAESLLHYAVMGKNATILTGAYLSNVHAYLEAYPADTVERMYIQGGFAGCNLVASENVLPKFKNKTEVRTFNFNCDKEAALYVLNSKQVVKRHLVAKNVCHGTLYDESLHVSLYNAANLSFGMMEVVNGMAKYGNMLKMKKRPFQKMLHDPLMALTFMCSLKGEKLCEFAEVNLLLNGDKWSSERANGTNTFISIACDYDRFYKKLFELK